MGQYIIALIGTITAVIRAVIEYNDLVITHIKGHDVGDYPRQHDKLLSRCFKEMRIDLYGHKNKFTKTILKR
jgi:hypothetical protein